MEVQVLTQEEVPLSNNSLHSTLGHTLGLPHRALWRELLAPWQEPGCLSMSIRAKGQNIPFAC